VAARKVHFVEDITPRSHSTATGYDNESGEKNIVVLDQILILTNPFILRYFKLFLHTVASPKLFTYTTLRRNLLAGFEPTNPASEQTQFRRRVYRNRQFML